MRLSNFTMEVVMDSASYVTQGKEYDARLCMQQTDVVNEIKLYRHGKYYGTVVRRENGDILLDE